MLIMADFGPSLNGASPVILSPVPKPAVRSSSRRLLSAMCAYMRVVSYLAVDFNSTRFQCTGDARTA
jgi:hypothetical protein